MQTINAAMNSMFLWWPALVALCSIKLAFVIIPVEQWLASWSHVLLPLSMTPLLLFVTSFSVLFSRKFAKKKCTRDECSLDQI